MKIKNDFVTNSSSTSYLIVIPDAFKPEKYFNKFMEKVEGYHEGDLDIKDQDLLDEMQLNLKGFTDRIDKLRRGVSLYADDNIVYPISDLFQELGLVLDSLDGGPDEMTLVGINQDKFRDLCEKFGILDSKTQGGHFEIRSDS